MKEPGPKAQSPPPFAGPELLPPPRIPDHELLRRIGRGSYGEVWLARSVTGSYRALKIVSRQSFDHDRPFEREFSGILQFEPISRKHDSQVDILHVGRGADYFYYVMELADDQMTGPQINPDSYAPKTLKSEWFQRGELPFEECVQISLALTTALEHLHANGLVHRDVKPSNIIFINGIPKLADIGLVTGVDATRSFVGTEGFAPPEGPGTPQTDIYSLGKVLYEISTGKDRQDFPELPTNLDALSDREALLELNAVIAKACRENPRDRYPSAHAMHDELLLLQSGKSLARLHTMQRTVAKLKRVSMAIAVITVLSLAAWLYQSRQTRQLKLLAAENLNLARQAEASVAESRENLYAADINQAQHALAADNLRQALQLLRPYIPKAGEKDLRGFEWRYLWQQCQSQEFFSLPGHQEPATCLAFSPDGRLLATGSWDHTVKIWDLVSHLEVSTLRGHADAIESVSFSSRGHFLATASKTVVRVWDTQTFQAVCSLAHGASKALYSPDGEYLLLRGADLILFATRTWKIVKRLEGASPPERFQAGAEMGLAFSPEGKRVALASDDGVRFLSLPSLQEEGVLTNHLPRIQFVAFSPSGGTLATASIPGRGVTLWNLSTGEPISISGHSDSVFVAVFSPDGEQFATCSSDQTVKLWNAASRKLVRAFKGHTDEVYDVAFSPDGKLLASVAKNGAVKLWDATAKPEQLLDLPGVASFGFRPDGNLLTVDTSQTSSGDDFLPFTTRKLLEFDPRTLTNLSCRSINKPYQGFSVFVGNSYNDGATIGLGDYSWSETQGTPMHAKLELIDLNRGRYLCSIENSISGIAAFAPKRRLLATCTSNQTVTLWGIPEGSRKYVLTNAVGPLAFSRDETLLATSAEEQGWQAIGVKIWKFDRDYPSQLTIFHGDKVGVEALAFSPDGKILATADTDGLIRLWAVPSARQIGTLTGHKRNGFSISFSPDSRTLASVSDDRTIRLWHLPTQRELIRFEAPTDEPIGGALEFSPDGRALLAATGISTGSLSRVYFAPSFPEISLAGGKDYKPVMSDKPATWLATGKALARMNRNEEALQCLTRVIRGNAHEDSFESLRLSALRARAPVLERLGRFAEAGEDNCAALNISPRDLRTPSTCIDLSFYFNRPLNSESPSIPPTPFLDDLSQGLHTLPGGGTNRFDIRGVVQLRHDVGNSITPASLEAIQIKQKCRRVHFLQSAHFKENEDTVVAAFVIHYANGKQEEVPVRYGQHIRDWVVSVDPGELRGGKVAWTGMNSAIGPIRIFEQSWENPHPEIRIETLDFISKMTRCAPFLIAITVE